MNKISIYVMTAIAECRPAQAWGAVIESDGKTEERTGIGEPNTTPLAMELTAITQALADIDGPCDVDIYSEFTSIGDAINVPRTVTITDGRPESGAWKRLLQEINGRSANLRLKWRQINDRPENEHVKRCKELAALAVLGHNPAAMTADRPSEYRTHSVQLSDGDIETLRIALFGLGSKYRNAQLPTAASRCFALESRLRDIQLGKD